MIFSTIYFLFLYFPIVLILYYITPLKWRNIPLFIVSLVFYGWGEPVYLFVMLASITINYLLGLVVDRYKRRDDDKGARMAVAASVVINLAILFFFKYWDFIAGSLEAVGLTFMPKLGLELPIGISFYTFQTMSYTVDVYRGDGHCQRNPITFGTFVTLFPQLIAGPIIQYKDLDKQLEKRTHSAEGFASGVQVFVIGMAKKVLLANNLGMLWDVYKATPVAELTTAGAWLGILAFSLQLYFDFSGYSDMAVGMGRMLGFSFMRNFNYPYISKSVTEFWRRWHISLGNWFRDYVYIPLGGNRVSKGRHLVNLLVVWALTGIWHGASWNFLFWGLYFAVLIIAEKFFLLRWLEKLPSFVQHLYTVFVVLVSWAIFAVEDFGQMRGYLAAMFGFAGGGAMNASFGYYFRSYLPTLVLAILACVPLWNGLWQRLEEKKPVVLRVALPVLLLGGLLLCTSYLVDATYNPFLYFRF
ncbi:MBOAT family protein [Pseudoflavonifractor phocaeensis]|uniref:MBOAT family O-acyltransferase n=1 Tax=Pseudoflavonifractor phocaeensis TaxID=1870988 RepID=UPI00195B0512|nr:MBOAT family O-acyltransferase [Pseudoflavonifractor phocaeensis]MBM6938762.1 MBOAT family protein [Pseudoflavonifractor phocaeensis]